MRPIRHPVTVSVGLGLLALLATDHRVRANPPLLPFPAPQYSFDLDSPCVEDGDASADSILEFMNLRPQTVTSGPAIGLGAPGDELDALSSGNAQLETGTRFSLLFSVDSGSIGLSPPCEDLVEEGVAYNVQDQAARGQQAGDQFMSLVLFNRDGLVEGEVFNNVLIRNNYDEGGTDFGALPPVSAEDIVIGSPQDNLDAMAYLDTGGVYFSASRLSPSLGWMSCLEAASGAHILFSQSGMVQPSLYADCAALGLQVLDDIDALLVFDTNSDGQFNGVDQVLFSLTSDSPSLALIPGASEWAGGADVFTVTAGGEPAVFASAEVLGLGAPQDNLDALELLLCDDAEHCAQLHGILSPSSAEPEEADEPEEEDEDDGSPDDPEDDEEGAMLLSRELPGNALQAILSETPRPVLTGVEF